MAKRHEFNYPAQPDPGRELYAVQGSPLAVDGVQKPIIYIGDNFGLTAQVEMTVTDSEENLLSVDSLLKHGNDVVFSRRHGCYIENDKGNKIHLDKIGKRWFVKARKSDPHARHVGDTARIAPVSQASSSDAMPGSSGPPMRTPPEFSEPSPGQVKDYWEEKDGWLVRHHVMPRMAMFTPMGVMGHNRKRHEFSGRRRTVYTAVEGPKIGERDVVVDNWLDGTNPTPNVVIPIRGRWTGQTQFELAVAPRDETENLDDDMSLEELATQAMGKTPKVPNAPNTPSAEEVYLHNLTHATYAPWCEHCVLGQGRDKPHTRSKEEPADKRIKMDYVFFSRDGSEAPEGHSRLATALTAVDETTQACLCVYMTHKGSDTYLLKALEKWITHLGWKKITLMSDNENPVTALAEKLQRRMGYDKVQLKNSPKYSPASKGVAETINQILAGKIRTWLSALSREYGQEVSVNHQIFPWLCKYVAWARTRFHKIRGVTPFHVVEGHEYSSELVPFGETVMARWPDAGNISKSKPRWIKGIYVGKTDYTDEHIVMSECGTHTPSGQSGDCLKVRSTNPKC